MKRSAQTTEEMEEEEAEAVHHDQRSSEVREAWTEGVSDPDTGSERGHSETLHDRRQGATKASASPQARRATAAAARRPGTAGGNASASQYSTPRAKQSQRRPMSARQPSGGRSHSSAARGRSAAAGAPNSARRAASRGSSVNRSLSKDATQRLFAHQGIAGGHRATRAVAALEASLEKEREEMKECTFKPQTRPLPSYYGSAKLLESVPFEERVVQWATHKTEEAEKRRRSEADKELEECTFKPQINESSRRTAMRNRHQELPASERLYRTAMERTKGRVAASEQEPYKYRTSSALDDTSPGSLRAAYASAAAGGGASAALGFPMDRVETAGGS